MFILKKEHQPGLCVTLRALFLVLVGISLKVLAKLIDRSCDYLILFTFYSGSLEGGQGLEGTGRHGLCFEGVYQLL